MKRILTLMFAAVLAMPVAFADPAAPAPEAQAEMELKQMLEEAERARMEAESARREAERVAHAAHEAARARSEQAEAEAAQRQERSRERTAEIEQREAEMARAREELSRAHRELREASREVARAHRELARADRVATVAPVVNLGDQAVIGVVLGEESGDGVKIIGVSPDGPAESAGVKVGDLLVAIRGKRLAEAKGSARSTVFRIMDEIEVGEKLELTVERDGKPLKLTVTAERREPGAWQSMIHIPEVEIVEDAPGRQRVVVERIEIPEIDQEAMAARIAEMQEKLENRHYLFATPEGGELHLEGDFDIDFDEFSEMAGQAMSEANIWFGLPQTRGLELATINEGLGTYFKTDRGVLVIRANEDNAYGLESGDVILKVGAAEVDSPAELMRALRELNPGEDIELAIKRDRRDRTLKAVMPENRLGLR
jgi:C-terminal processing protease CtpA/Prc